MTKRQGADACALVRRLPSPAGRLACADSGSAALATAFSTFQTPTSPDDLFTHVVAFSPGFASPSGRVGQRRIFVAHGLHDGVLPILLCSRRVVPELRRDGYDVTYREFDGPHVVPPSE